MFIGPSQLELSTKVCPLAMDVTIVGYPI